MAQNAARASHMQKRMELRWTSDGDGAVRNPSIRNAGERYSQIRATPFATRQLCAAEIAQIKIENCCICTC